MDNPVKEINTTNISTTPAVAPPPSTPKDVVESNLSPKDFTAIPMEDITLSAHEVRTVLTVMRNYLWVSTYQKDEPLGPKVKRNLNIVSYALDYLVMLVENNLTVKKIDKNEVKLASSEKDLIELVNEVMEEYTEKAQIAGLSLLCEPSVQKAVTNVDIIKIKDAIGRIIENAIKFTPQQGKISFKVVESDDENFYEIRISDTGPGIAIQYQKDLFKKYGKIDESYANVNGRDGAGLGLYIAKKYVQMHKGDITVKSDAGAGCIFVVSLPMKQ